MRRKPLILGFAVAAMLLFGFWELAGALATSPAVVAFDETVSAVIQSLRSDTLTAIMKLITATGGFAFSATAALVCFVMMWRRGYRRDATLLASVVVTTTLLTTALKGLIGRERPPASNALLALPESFSFPSGHTTASLALGGVLAYLSLHSSMSRAGRVLGIAFAIAYPVLVGTSRVYLGVHWPSDVLASWMLAGAVLAGALGIRESLR